MWFYSNKFMCLIDFMVTKHIMTAASLCMFAIGLFFIIFTNL